jgi:hypothetical protein
MTLQHNKINCEAIISIKEPQKSNLLGDQGSSIRMLQKISSFGIPLVVKNKTQEGKLKVGELAWEMWFP